MQNYKRWEETFPLGQPELNAYHQRQNKEGLLRGIARSRQPYSSDYVSAGLKRQHLWMDAK
jgi:hypothetical protein